MPKEQVEIHLRYEGPEVEDGTMSIQDIVPVLQGFASAYGKLAAVDDPQSTHRVRITAVRPGSADIVLEVWKLLGDNVNAITATGVVSSGAYFLIRKIAGVIALKRHTRKQPFRERIAASDRILITNADNVTLDMPLDVYELFKAGTLDADLNKITSPLVPGRIDAAELEARAVDGTVLRERITAEERPYFETHDVIVTTTKETWITGKLNALSKSTESGWIYLLDGTRLFYKWVGDDPAKLHRIFGTYEGPVKVYGVAHMDESLKVTQIDISDIEKLQGELFPSSPDGDDDVDPPR